MYTAHAPRDRRELDDGAHCGIEGLDRELGQRDVESRAEARHGAEEREYGPVVAKLERQEQLARALVAAQRRVGADARVSGELVVECSELVVGSDLDVPARR
jgi:hypothetical protein